MYMKKNFRILCVSLSFLAAAILASRSLYSRGYRVNLSESLPGVVYLATPLEAGGMIERGDCVLIDLSRIDNPGIELGIRRGYVSRKRRMLKEIGAIPGDMVALRDNRLFVNEGSTPMIVSSGDSRGGELLPYPTPLVLSRDYYWLVSVPYRGFDSRYFGPIHRSTFTHRAERVF
jgi:conjugative transfer signal peptidase TraF